MSYARVYKGNLNDAQTLLNANRNIKEKNFRLFIPYSDILQPAEGGVQTGDIVVISDLKNTVTGDTLCHGFIFNFFNLLFNLLIC